MSSACNYCGSPLADAPARACPSCRDGLHADCLAQIRAREITGCGHPTGIAGCVYLAEGRVLSLDHEGSLRAWDLATGTDRELRRMPQGGTHLLVSGDRARVIVANSQALTVLRASDDAVEATLNVAEGLGELAVSADGARVAFAAGQTVRLGEPARERATDVGAALPEWIVRVAISPDGTRVAALYGQTHVVARDADTGETLFEQDLASIGTYFDKLEFAPTGDVLYVEGSANLIALDGYTGQRRWTEAPGIGPFSLRANEDGTYTLVSVGAYNDIQVHRLDRAAAPPLGAPRTFSGLSTSASRAGFLDAHRLVVGADDGTLLVIDAAKDTRRVLDGHRNASHVAPDQAARRLWTRAAEMHSPEAGAMLDEAFVQPGATGTGYGLRRIAVGTGALGTTRDFSESPSQVRVVRAQAGAPSLLLGAVNNGFVLCDPAQYEQRWRTDTGRYSDLGSAVILPDERGRPMVLASSSWSPLVQALDLETGALRWTVERAGAATVPQGNLVRRPDGTVLWLLQRTGGSAVAIECVQLTAEGEGGTAAVIECPLPLSVAFGAPTRDGTHLVVGTIQLPPRSLAAAGLFDLVRMEFVGPVTAGHRNWMRHLAVSPLGTLLATASGTRLVHLWELPTGRRLASFGPLPRAASHVAFSDDGATLLSFAEDGGATAWDLAGLDARTDAYALFRSTHPEAVRAARVVRDAVRERPAPAPLAALLLDAASRDSLDAQLAAEASSWPEPVRAALTNDRDARVRSMLARLTSP